MGTNFAIPMGYVNYRFQQNQEKAKSKQKAKTVSKENQTETVEQDKSIFAEEKSTPILTKISGSVQIKLDNTLRETIKYLKTKGYEVKAKPEIEKLLDEKTEELTLTDIMDLEIDYTNNIFAA